MDDFTCSCGWNGPHLAWPIHRIEQCPVATAEQREWAREAALWAAVHTVAEGREGRA